MRIPRADQSNVAHSPARTKKPVEPSFPTVSKLPTTLAELFRSIALTVTPSDPIGKQSGRKPDYALPWAGFIGML